MSVDQWGVVGIAAGLVALLVDGWWSGRRRRSNRTGVLRDRPEPYDWSEDR